ncbi:MAG: RNA methyltransferase [Oscillospiraceae bacterium]|nr:RNA methyltransferase [Oscillospiraceae bacterium]
MQVGTSNKTVRLFANLNRSRSFREKHGCFPLEGFRLVLDALQSGVKPQALLLTEKAQAQYGAALREAAPNLRELLISDALAKEIADTETAQGVFAIAEMLPETALMPKKGDRCMLLHCVQDPSNLGAVLRTAEALGTDGLYLFQCCDLYNPKVIRGSMGALFRIPLRRLRDMNAFFAHCDAEKMPTCAAVVDRDANLLGSYDFSGGACVLIGNEGNGLPREISDACTERLTIPMAPASNSLNAAMAAGLFLWEMAKI